MTYKATLDWMFGQLPFYQQKGKSAFNGKLDNSIAFASYLHHPQNKFKSIHVAGTNGKGSSCHMLASVLQEAGYRVGLYTSPHLKDFRERIKINGKCIGKKSVVRFIGEHKTFLEANRLSFFEMTVGMAFAHFAKKNVDIAIIEVGLGGRLDSTNIITPEVSLITNIGMDHTDILGKELVHIATEKAGIIKPKVPVVISETQEDIAGTFKSIAASMQSKITFADQLDLKTHKTDLLGVYQKKNVGGILAVLNELQGFTIKKKHVKRGLASVVKHTGLLGRWQRLKKKPLVICDTAHNKEGLSMVLKQLQNKKYGQLHFVLGFVKDKNMDSILNLFPKNATYYFSKPNIYRGLEVEDLLESTARYDLEGRSFRTVKQAYKAALKQAARNDIIYVGGSTFVVAEVL